MYNDGFIYRFLATGHTFRSLAFEFRLGRSTVSAVIRETSNVMWSSLKDRFMLDPTTEDWIKIANDFKNRTNFPNCIGTLDGKHVRLVKPAHSASQFYNYKNFISIVLLGLVDANYCFISIDVGRYGKSADSNIFRKSVLHKKLTNGSLNLPKDAPLPYSEQNTCMPLVFVADEAFAMTSNVMTPYSRKTLNNKKSIFNYRLSRAWRYVEYAFGILSNKWHVFHTAIQLDPDFVENIVSAACVLHNFVRWKEGYKFEDTLTCDLTNIPANGTGGAAKHTKKARESFADYFVSPAGSVPWQ